MTRSTLPTDHQPLFVQQQHSNEAYYPPQQGLAYGSNQSSAQSLLSHPPLASPPYSINSLSQTHSSDHGIVDLVVPNGLECRVDKNILATALVNEYSRQTFDADNSKVRRCSDYLLALLGPLGAGLCVGMFVAAAFVPGLRLQIWYPVIFGCLLIAIYAVSFIKPVFASCLAKDKQMHDRATSGSFGKATFQRESSDPDTITSSISNCKNDIPQLLVTVVCSHAKIFGYATKDGSEFDRTVVFRETYALPLAHFRFLGTSPHQFLSTIDSLHSGDCTIEFEPKVIAQVGQEGYLQQFMSTVYSANKDKAVNCSVFARLVCGQYDANGIWTQPKMTEEVAVECKNELDVSNHDKYGGYGNFDQHSVQNQARNHAQNQPQSQSQAQQRSEDLIPLKELHVATSLGRRTEFYQANGQAANGFLRCMTSPVVWIASAVSCLFILVMPFLQCRWKHLKYHSTFEVIFPHIDQILEQFKTNPDDFIAHPPRVLNGMTTRPWDV